MAVESAQDHIITDVDGKKYIDFIAQFSVMNFGYSHPKIVKAAAEQIQKMPLVGTLYISPLYAEFAERITTASRPLSSITIWCLTRVEIWLRPHCHYA